MFYGLGGGLWMARLFVLEMKDSHQDWKACQTLQGLIIGSRTKKAARAFLDEHNRHLRSNIHGGPVLRRAGTKYRIKIYTTEGEA